MIFAIFDYVDLLLSISVSLVTLWQFYIRRSL